MPAGRDTYETDGSSMSGMKTVSAHGAASCGVLTSQGHVVSLIQLGMHY